MALSAGENYQNIRGCEKRVIPGSVQLQFDEKKSALSANLATVTKNARLSASPGCRGSRSSGTRMPVTPQARHHFGARSDQQVSQKVSAPKSIRDCQNTDCRCQNFSSIGPIGQKFDVFAKMAFKSTALWPLKVMMCYFPEVS